MPKLHAGVHGGGKKVAQNCAKKRAPVWWGAWHAGAGLRTLRVGGSEAALGAQRPVPARPRAGARLSLEESRRKEHQGGRGSSSLDPPFLVWGDPAGSSLFSAWPAALYLTPVTARPPAGRAGRVVSRTGRILPTLKAFPLGGRCPSAHTGADGGATLYPTFPCRKKARSRLSPQRGFSIAPLGNPVAPSSVTFGDSFPPRGSLWAVQPYTKKRSKSGYADGTVIAPQPEQCATTAKTRSGNERALTPGVQGACPRPSFPHFSGEMGTPRQAGPPGRCAPRHRKSPDHPKGTQYPTAPRPGPGGKPPRRF